jgi:ribose-phosphate pyrophosphokinase
MEQQPLALFALQSSRAFGEQVASHLGTTLAPHEEREFEDGEHKVRPLESVRGRDVYVLQSLYADAHQGVNDKLVRMLFFLGALHDAGAARVTAVIPYLAYARKDARTQPRDPLTTRYVAQLIEAVGTDRVVVLDVHNPAAFQNSFRVRAEHLDTAQLFAERLATLLHDVPRIAVVSPDPGGFKRADRLRQALARRLGRESATAPSLARGPRLGPIAEPELAFLEKARARGELRSGRLVGEVDGATAVIVDDIVASGGTLAAAARACRAAGARNVLAAATHGLFVGQASAVLADEALEQLLVTDTVPPFRLDPALVTHKLEIVPAAGLIAEAIRRLNANGSLVELLAI